MDPTGSSVRVFDGTSDFRVWRARVENELMRYHLLGYVMVRGYDGSQSFTFNDEEVPPRFPVVHLDDSQHQVKEEAALANEASGLSRWDMLGECAEAKSILQRFLHPDVESAILNKNVYESWMMLCSLYGNRSSPGAHDVYEMHRVLHHMRFGDKKSESMREFVTRWEMVMQQYAVVTGIQLTDGFRSAMFVQTLPRAWRVKVSTWRGIRPFVPYPELVEKVLADDESIRTDAESDPVKATSPANKSRDELVFHSTDSSVDRSRDKVAEKSVEKPAENSSDKLESHSVDKRTTARSEEVVEKAGVTTTSTPEKRSKVESVKTAPIGVRCGKESTCSTATPVPPRIDVSAKPDKFLELTRAKVSSTSIAPRSLDADTTEKAPEQSDKIDTSEKSSKENNKPKKADSHDKYSKLDSCDKYDKDDSRDKLDSHDKLDKDDSDSYSARGTHDKYSNYHSGSYDRLSKYNRTRYKKSPAKYESGDHYNNDKRSGLPSCFYCLKVGHTLRQCWFLKADISNRTTHEQNKKYSCSVTIDRSDWMVKGIEKYIDEVNQARRDPYDSPRSSRRGSDYGFEMHRDHLYASSTPTTQSSSYSTSAFQQQPPPPSPTNYQKRSRSVFKAAESRVVPSRDPRLQRSRSMYRSSNVEEDFSPRKRPRAPSFERQRSYGY